MYDVCIAGGGIAGATMAAFLGKNGKKVVVIEKDLSERDVIIGELLQPGGYHRLQELGLGFFIDNIDARPVYGYGMFQDGEQYEIKYPLKEGEAPGYGFRNGKFLQNMRKFIIENENVTVIEGQVTDLIKEGDTVTGLKYIDKATKENKTVTAPLSIISDGPISKFREELATPHKQVSGYFLGMILENPETPYPSHGHLFIGDHSPFVIYPVTSDHWRVLIDYKGGNPPKFGPGLKEQLRKDILPHVHPLIVPSFEAAIEKGKFKTFPNHRLPAEPKRIKGAVLLGDSLLMRHPITGGGMTGVFADVQILGGELLKVADFTNAKAVTKAVNNFYDNRHLGNQTINILADGLYGVVYNPALRNAFFDYVKRGGKYSEEPLAILGGLNRDKALLQKHFFAVAGYGVKEQTDFTKVAGLKGSYSMLKDAVKIIKPLLLSEKPDTSTKLLLKMLS